MPLELSLDHYDNGFRPTAGGRVGGRPLVFRLMSGRWFFGVAGDGVETVWWHSEDSEFAFGATGEADDVWHTDSLPYFLEGLGQYLDSLAIEGSEREAILERAAQLARDLFARDA